MLKLEEAQVHQFLMALVDLIAHNQIYFFQQSLRKSRKEINSKNNMVIENIPVFRILPRAFDQTAFSCIFVPDKNAMQDLYFLTVLEQKFFYADADVDTMSSIDFPTVKAISEIQPNFEMLQNYGLLPKSCKKPND